MNMTQDIITEIAEEADKKFNEYKERAFKDGFSSEKAKQAIKTCKEFMDQNKNHPFYFAIQFFMEHAVCELNNMLNEHNASNGGAE